MAQIDYSKTSTEIDGWFGFQTPAFMVILLGIYLLIVIKIGPSYMKNRPAYSLKTFISVYNVVQVIACFWIIIKIFQITSTKIFIIWKCTHFDSNSSAEYLFNRATYFVFWLKIVELSETVIFVLRKKQNQVSFLHVFHHCSAITLVYLLIKYYRGGAALYPLLLNSIVHIVMYSYYLAAAVCDKDTIRRLSPIKKSITIVQMIQFVMILIQASILWMKCDIPNILTFYYFMVIAVIFYGFYDFYQKAYTPKTENSSKVS